MEYNTAGLTEGLRFTNFMQEHPFARHHAPH